MGPEQYLFITPVWGDAYVERFLKVCLPAQLSAGNLGAMPPEKSLFLIYTRREHARTITRSPAYRRLRAMIPASVRSLDDLPDPRLSKNPHELQTAAYMRGIRAGEGKESAFVFLTPDILLGDGTYRNMVLRAEEGKRIHLVAGIRMLTEGAVSCVVQHQCGHADVTIPCRNLVRACLDNLHPISAAHLVTDGKVFAAQHLYWRVGDHGLLARGFHLHPLLVWPRNPGAVIRNTLDDEYVSRACPDRADWHTVTDSDEMCVIEFSDRLHKAGMIHCERLTDGEVNTFLHNCTTADHRDHVLSPIRFHSEGLADPAWAQAVAQSDVLVDKYLALHSRGLAAALVQEDEIGVRPGRIQILFGRSKSPSGGRSFAGLLTFLAPLRLLHRAVHFKLYRYADRLNATILHQQKQLEQAHKQLTIVSKLVEEMMVRLDRAEEDAKCAAIRSSNQVHRPARRRRKLSATG